jgi:hypothetical protein
MTRRRKRRKYSLRFVGSLSRNRRPSPSCEAPLPRAGEGRGCAVKGGTGSCPYEAAVAGAGFKPTPTDDGVMAKVLGTRASSPSYNERGGSIQLPRAPPRFGRRRHRRPLWPPGVIAKRTFRYCGHDPPRHCNREPKAWRKAIQRLSFVRQPYRLRRRLPFSPRLQRRWRDRERLLSLPRLAGESASAGTREEHPPARSAACFSLGGCVAERRYGLPQA